MSTISNNSCDLPSGPKLPAALYFAEWTDNAFRDGIQKNINALVTTTGQVVDYHLDDDLEGLSEEIEHIESQAAGLKQMLSVAKSRGISVYR